jgi:hypothetical protein
MNAIERIERRWEIDAPMYDRETMLRKLCGELTKLVDDPAFGDSFIGPAEIKLSNALAKIERDPTTPTIPKTEPGISFSAAELWGEKSVPPLRSEQFFGAAARFSGA